MQGMRYHRFALNLSGKPGAEQCARVATDLVGIGGDCREGRLKLLHQAAIAEADQRKILRDRKTSRPGFDQSTACEKVVGTENGINRPDPLEESAQCDAAVLGRGDGGKCLIACVI